MQDGRLSVIRIQRNVVARRERQVLNWLCANLPLWVKPDHLTIVGVAGAVLIATSYALSRLNPAFLWVASFGLVLHWFGDSLDGSLARYRRIERPVYGYFLDHTVDAICNLVIMAGLGVTLYVRMDIALFALIGYYLLCIYVFINNSLSGKFQLSFLGCGPTELRLFLVGLNTGMFFVGRTGGMIGGTFISVYDGLVFFMGLAFTCVFLAEMFVGIRGLRDPDRLRPVGKPIAVPPPGSMVQSASMNVSSPAK